MAKISALPALAPEAIDGTETVPVVKAGLMQRAPLAALITGLAQPFVTLAQKWAEGTLPGGAGTRSAKEWSQDSAASALAAATSAAALGVTTQTTNDIVETDQDANGRWWVQKYADGTCRIQKLADARGNRLDQTITANTTRVAAAEGAITTLTGRADALDVNLALSTQTAHDVVDTDQDAYGRAWSQRMRDGSTRFAGIADMRGNRIDTIALSNRARAQALEDVNAWDVPANIKRLRRTYYEAPRSVLVQSASQFVSLSGNDNGDTNLIANGVTYDMADPRIRRLGGPWAVVSSTTPGNRMMRQRNVVYLTANGQVGGNPIIELLIDAGVTQIEWKGTGCTYVGVTIDGRMTQAMGEAVSPAISSGGYRTHLLTLTASASPRRVRLRFQADIQIGDVRVNAGGKLLDPARPRRGSVYIIGDSITEGTGASQVKITGWANRFGQMTGFDQVANGGVGGTGWVKSISTGENALSRIASIVTNVDGGPPDMLVCALGINDVSATQADLDAISANVTTFMTAMRASAPYMPIVVLGPFGGWGGWGAQEAKQSAIFAAANAFPFVHTIDTAPWWSVPAEYQTWYNQPVDPTHPIDTGHTAIATRARDAILPLLKDF